MTKEDSTFWLALVGAVGTAVIAPLILFFSQRGLRKSEMERQDREHEERRLFSERTFEEERRARERAFEEERRGRLHDARIEAHAELIRLCDDLRAASRRRDEDEGAYDERRSDLLEKATHQPPRWASTPQRLSPRLRRSWSDTASTTGTPFGTVTRRSAIPRTRFT